MRYSESFCGMHLEPEVRVDDGKNAKWCYVRIHSDESGRDPGREMARFAYWQDAIEYANSTAKRRTEHDLTPLYILVEG